MKLSIRLICHLDVVLVLGGGRPISLTEPPLYVQRRCDDAATIVRIHQHQQQQQQQREGRVPPILSNIWVVMVRAIVVSIQNRSSRFTISVFDSLRMPFMLAPIIWTCIKQMIVLQTAAAATTTSLGGFLIVTNDFHMN